MPTETWQRLPAERKHRVLSAAVSEFAEAGFGGASLNVIARQAQVAKGSLFQYFVDKRDLYTFVVAGAAARVREQLRLSLDRHEDEQIFSLLTNVYCEWMDYFVANPLDRALLAPNLGADGASEGRIGAQLSATHLGLFRAVLDRADERSELRPAADLDAFAALVVLLLPHLAMARAVPGTDPVLGLDSSQAADRLASVRRLVDVFHAAFAR